MAAETLYKILGLKGEAIHGGRGTWALPTGRRPGRWMPVIHDLVPCERGYHLVTAAQALDWVTPNCRIFTAEGRGSMVAADDKSAWAQARLVQETAWTPRCNRLFSADCAARVLHLFGWSSVGRAAARDAARDAARAAARAAAGYAERAWQIERLALYLAHGETVEPWPLPAKEIR